MCKAGMLPEHDVLIVVSSLRLNMKFLKPTWTCPKPYGNDIQSGGVCTVPSSTYLAMQVDAARWSRAGLM